ncbi:MAG: alanine racemase [Actinomycetota bacterium]|nr:alanine racemase [Actinomycetota bacterium]
MRGAGASVAGALRFRPTVAEVDLDAIRHNARVLKPSSAELMAVVKGQGYGHGAVEVARAALEAGATWLGVALVEEGIELREAGIGAPLLMLSEFPPGSERDALAAGITPTVYSDPGLDALARAGQDLDVTPRVHVKVDTGMHRVGLYPPERVLELVRRAVGSGCVLEGLWTHFAKAEDDEETTARQLRAFLDVARELAGAGFVPRYRHAANSAAAIRYPEAHLDLVRVGVALYGLDPGNGLAASAGLRPALTWRSAVSAVRRLPAGQAISYGHTYRLERETVVATVPVGYADGYRRALSSRADVLIGGKRRRVAGTVTMDQLMADCGRDEAGPGDEVVLIGGQGEEEITVGELAGLAGTIDYEVVCGIGSRVPRVYRGLAPGVMG